MLDLLTDEDLFLKAQTEISNGVSKFNQSSPSGETFYVKEYKNFVFLNENCKENLE